MNELGKFQTDHSSEYSAIISRPGNKISIWVIIGYIFFPFGGLIGIFIGSTILSAKKVLPGGQVIYSFNERSRRHGKIIVYLSSIILILSILFFMNWFFLEKILFGRRIG